MDLRFEGREVPALATLDPHGIVVHLYSLSKSLFPGARVGAITARGQAVEGLRALRHATDLGGSLVVQAAVADLLERGDYDRHLSRMRRILRSRMSVLLEALESEMPSGTRWTRPQGGYQAWVELPEPVDTRELLSDAMRAGVLFAPGTVFQHAGGGCSRAPPRGPTCGGSQRPTVEISRANVGREPIAEEEAMSQEHDERRERTGAESVEIKVGLAEMLKGGVIMDVTTPDQAKIAEEAGACAVMALERVPADIRKEGGVARMAAVGVIEAIQKSVSIPVMAKVRIGHFMEARVLEALGVDFIDESEVLTPADDAHHIDKHAFRSPFVCGCRNLGEALRRISEGAAMIRTKGEAGSGNIVEAVRHLRQVVGDLRAVQAQNATELPTRAKELGAPVELLRKVHETGRMPVPNFAAGGVATPADAALCMALGAEAVFVGSGIFKSEDPAVRARAIVRATTHWDDPGELVAACRGLGKAMDGIEMETLAEHERLANRGW
jgi:pyridoxal 5'-phosphate synthase pdxS subunit